MASVVLGGVRSKEKGKSRRPASGPSIREVCLLGIGARPVPEVACASGGRVTWSGRAYRVEATQVRAAEADEPLPLRYVHLSALAEGC
jgi:hypothetical protein